jgi:hypothetical protein
MRMSHLASIVFACSISLFSTASFAQSSSNDGRCDVLNDATPKATPSLYGLCIAYWATQENGNSTASSKILEKYNNRKSNVDPVDPSMPGLCPATCWTAAELDELKVRYNNNTCDRTDNVVSWIGNEVRLEANKGIIPYSCFVSSNDITGPERFDDMLDLDVSATCYDEVVENLCN